MKNRKKMLAVVISLVLGATLWTGCQAEELPKVKIADYMISPEAVGGICFESRYEDFVEEPLHLLYADALDGSYMQTIQAISNPENLDWREVLINSGITNTEDFSMLLMSGAIAWKEITVEESAFTYLDISAEGEDYAMGILHHPEASYGIMLYGTMLEEELLHNIAAIHAGAEGFRIELGGRIPYLTFSDGGAGMQSHSVFYFETIEQLDAYLISRETGIRAEDIQSTEETMTFAGIAMSVEGYGVNAKGKLSTSGDAKNMVYAEGIAQLPAGGFILVRFSQRTSEGRVAEMTQYLTTLEKYFTVTEQ